MPTTIKQCKHHGKTEFILEGRGSYRCRKCRSANVAKCRRNTKARLVEMFGGGCQVCGYSRCVRNLDFHHLDPKQKNFGIAAMGATKSFAKILAEAKKCRLLCKNCHGETEEGLLI